MYVFFCVICIITSFSFINCYLSVSTEHLCFHYSLSFYYHKCTHHMISHMTRTLLRLLFFFKLKDTYLYSGTSVFFFPLRCKSSLLFSLHLWLIFSSTVILFILGTYYQLISVFLSTEVTVILLILVYRSFCCV